MSPTTPRHLAAPPESRDDDPLVTTFMTTRVLGITPDAPVSAALALMASAGVRHLPVLSGDRCLGVVREADLVRHLAAACALSLVDPAMTPVARLAQPARSLPVSARRSDVSSSMGDDGYGDMDAVLITDRYGVVGIVTATDLIRSLTEVAPRVVRRER